MSYLRWEKIDSSHTLSNCPEHQKFTLLYGRTYTVGEGFDFSETNQYILNLKMSPLVENKSRLKYKQEAIRQFADEVIELFKEIMTEDISFVIIPIPPSKTKLDSAYDDRMEQVAKRISNYFNEIDYIPLLETKTSKESFSKSRRSRNWEYIYDNLSVNNVLLNSDLEDKEIILIDDVLTSGAHFYAARQKLMDYSLNCDCGIFWAKSYYPMS